MKLKTIYCNNLAFTYKNISEGLYKFWMTDIIVHNNKKIWLTIDVNLFDGNTIKLIKKLPFNTSDFDDLLLVIADKIKTNLLHSRADELDSISITYIIKDNTLKPTKFNYKKLFTFLLLPINVVLFVLLSYLLLKIQSVPLEITKEEVFSPDKQEINHPLSLFIDLFKSDKNMYFPSYFLPDNTYNVVNEKECVESFIVKCVRNKQYETLNYLTQITIEHLITMQTINNEYSNIIKDITV